MPRRRNQDRRDGEFNGYQGEAQRCEQVMVHVLPEDGSGAFRQISAEHIRYYFTGSAWYNGVVARQHITDMFHRRDRGPSLIWRQVPIKEHGLYVRTEKAVFRLAKIRALDEVSREVEGNLLRVHQSVLINKKWIHAYYAVATQLSVLVEDPEGGNLEERVEVSLRNKSLVEKDLFRRAWEAPNPDGGPEEAEADT